LPSHVLGLDPRDGDAIEAAMFRHGVDLFKLDVDLVFYEVTA